MRSPVVMTGFAAMIIGLSGGVSFGVEEFKPLVKGEDVGQFELVGIGPETISIRDGEVILNGKKDGYFATKGAYSNYVLRFEWKYDRPEGLKSDTKFLGNSGLLMHIALPHKVWPKCIEAQLLNADAGNTFAIGGSKFVGKKDAEAQKRAIKRVGEWNQQEVRCEGDSIVCTINGVEIARGKGALPASGPIGWQSEGSVVRFRKIEIKKLD